MTDEQCVTFLTALKATQIRIKDSGWVVASCPLAKWLHTHHADHSPSFGLSVVPGGRSFYTCFTCESGSAEELLQRIELYTKEQPEGYNFALCHQLLADEVYLAPLPAYGARPERVTFEEWPSWWQDSFPPADTINASWDYLSGRGVTIETAVAHRLRYDAKRSMIVCPYVDVFGRLAGARGRSILPDVSGPKKHFDYTWQGKNNARLVWYHEEALQLPGPVVAVEGQFDCWKVQQAYPKVVAALTAKPSWEKFQKLSSASMVIQIPDNDDAGAMSTKVYAKHCATLGITYRLCWLDKGVKDPADCSVAYLCDRIHEFL